MSVLNAVVLLIGGVAAGFVNSMAGGGSLLTVPLLAVVGVDGLSANGTNRLAVMVQNFTSAVGYARGGVLDVKATLPLVLPALAGGVVGSLAVSEIADDTFERVFGLLMIPLLILVLVKPTAAPKDGSQPMSPLVASAMLFGLGLYMGAIQAGAGLLVLMFLARTGRNLISANGVKTLIILAVSALVAVPIFAWNGDIELLPGLVLSVGTGLGGYVGSRVAVRGGERVIKPVLVVAVVALAGRMLGLYG